MLLPTICSFVFLFVFLLVCLLVCFAMYWFSPESINPIASKNAPPTHHEAVGDDGNNHQDGEGKDCDCGKANLIEEYSGYTYRLFRLIKRHYDDMH